MRLFIAIELPDDVKRELDRLWTDIPGARRVPTDQIHLTLAFLGEVQEAALERLAGDLARIQVPEFRLSLSTVGCFPNRHRPRVLWVGPIPHPLLKHLVAGVREAVLAGGLSQEERPFFPHITLARLKLASSRECDAFLDQDPKQKPLSFPVREFTLFQSRLTPQGALHTPLRSFPLAVADAVGKA